MASGFYSKVHSIKASRDTPDSYWMSVEIEGGKGHEDRKAR